MNDVASGPASTVYVAQELGDRTTAEDQLRTIEHEYPLIRKQYDPLQCQCSDHTALFLMGSPPFTLQFRSNYPSVLMEKIRAREAELEAAKAGESCYT